MQPRIIYGSITWCIASYSDSQTRLIADLFTDDIITQFYYVFALDF